MRRGCISLGNLTCDGCHRSILYPERYLYMENAKGKNQALCMDCCLKRGLVKPESDKEGAEMVFDLSNE